MHPGGLNVAFCDGSVHFIKDTISSWPTDKFVTGGSLAQVVRVNDGSATPCYPQVPMGLQCVWQSLSTIAGAEVISADQF